jgi:2-dehydro-3-deoxyphosphogluconate aldolase/(4S)-4-hydroxy-2-oxoglutarate aldolase
MTQAQRYQRIADVGVMPVVRAASAGLALHAVDALVAGGIPVIEITLTVPGALGVLRQVADRFGDSVLLGAGTVLQADQARAALDAGAQFIVSPGLNLALLELGQTLDVPVIPGALTPSEIMAALRHGAQWVKIFPCSALGGASYLRALRGPFPDLNMLPTGGVSLANAAEHLAAGAAALGLGSELVKPAELQAGQHASLRERAQQLVSIVRAARSKAPASDITQSAVPIAGAAPETSIRGV